MCGRQTVCIRRQSDAPGLLGGTNGDPIDTRLDRKITREDVIVVVKKPRERGRRETLRVCGCSVSWRSLCCSLRDAAAPLSRATQREVNHVERIGNATPALIDYLNVDQRKIGAVGTQATGAEVRCQADRSRCTCGDKTRSDKRMMIQIVACRSERSGLEDNVSKGEEEVVRRLLFAE